MENQPEPQSKPPSWTSWHCWVMYEVDQSIAQGKADATRKAASERRRRICAQVFAAIAGAVLFALMMFG